MSVSDRFLFMFMDLFPATRSKRLELRLFSASARVGRKWSIRGGDNMCLFV